MRARDRRAVNRAFANLGKAIEAYERRLRLAPARFDVYVAAALAGDRARMGRLLDEREVTGLRLFVGEAHCIDCHSGPLLTNGEFHNTGIPQTGGADTGRLGGLARLRTDEFNCLGPYSDAAPTDCRIRFLVAGGERFRAAFKPPSLRNVSRRAPNTHAGRLATLLDVVRHYNRAPRAPLGRSELHPLGLADAQLAALVAFLRTLESPLRAPAGYLRPS